MGVTARLLILDFLECVKEARIERLCRYMDTQPLSYAPGTTKNTVSRLVRAGLVRRVGYGRYRIGRGGQAEDKPTP